MSAEDYVAYLETAEGRLRCDLLWSGLKGHLPDRGQALDAGCGPGELTARLLKRRLTVVALDADPDMLTRVLERAPRAQRVHADFLEAPDRLGRERFAVVTAHMALDYADDPAAAFAALAACVAPGGLLSVAARSRSGEALEQARRRALRSAAGALWSGRTHKPGMDHVARLLTARQLDRWAGAAGLALADARVARVLTPFSAREGILGSRAQRLGESWVGRSRVAALLGRYLHRIYRR
jgi:S-adenosylmethionine-dependent methyltransferase